MNAYLESALNLAEYREAKNTLINQKQLLKDKLAAFEQKAIIGSNSPPIHRSSKQAKIIALQENPVADGIF